MTGKMQYVVHAELEQQFNTDSFGTSTDRIRVLNTDLVLENKIKQGLDLYSIEISPRDLGLGLLFMDWLRFDP